ncbi:Rad52/Rad22 family DNA repair protein [Microvirga tunisiensis]|uniref:DNA repair protein n=1 Tax=Microvirga tunisiensis TaxID=2108360 RepID=A0A5N7MB14_9HYPH|nr:Rad52/Rad22 family DNA repair protein [Microvirga tunisiensis]MPR05678.1 hypothetical protein [Microvirga tunisiensis]MPR23878.1 hypothetical protein [Microvirga tunisiensis]
MNATTPIDTLRNKLLTPVPEQALQKRDGPGGRKYHYVDGDFAAATLNELFGFENVSVEVIESKQVLDRKYTQKKGGNAVKNRETGQYEASRVIETPYIEVVYAATVRIELDVDGKKVVRDGSGTCSANGPCDDSTAVAKIFEMAIKGAETDALKRAAKKFGPRLGLSLDINGKQLYATMSEDALLEDSYREGNSEEQPQPAAAQTTQTPAKQAPRSAQELEREARAQAGQQPAQQATQAGTGQPARTASSQPTAQGQARPPQGQTQQARPAPAPQQTPPAAQQPRPAQQQAATRPQSQAQPQPQNPTTPASSQARPNGSANPAGNGQARTIAEVEPTEEQLKMLDSTGWTAQFKALNSKLQGTSTQDQVVDIIKKMKVYRPLMQVGEDFAESCEKRMIELIQAHAQKINVNVQAALFAEEQAHHEPDVPF